MTDPTETPDTRLETTDMATVVHAHGHANVSGTHASTFEVTAEEFLTPAGDCIVGIAADVTPADAPEAFYEACRSRDARITATLGVRDGQGGGTEHTETIRGRGHPEFTFASETSMVFRTSDYVDDRTVMVEADKSAGDLDRDLVDRLAAGAPLRLVLRVE